MHHQVVAFFLVNLARDVFNLCLPELFVLVWPASVPLTMSLHWLHKTPAPTIYFYLVGLQDFLFQKPEEDMNQCSITACQVFQLVYYRKGELWLLWLCARLHAHWSADLIFFSASAWLTRSAVFAYTGGLFFFMRNFLNALSHYVWMSLSIVYYWWHDHGEDRLNSIRRRHQQAVSNALLPSMSRLSARFGKRGLPRTGDLSSLSQNSADESELEDMGVCDNDTEEMPLL